MKLESIINEPIDEKALVKRVFIPILESTDKELPFVSIESRMAIEDYVIDIINKDLLQVKIDFESLFTAHNNVLEEVKAKQSEDLDATFSKSVMAISKISSLLNFNTPQISGNMSLPNNERILGEKINKIRVIVDDLINIMELIDSKYKGAEGHLKNAMSRSHSTKGYENINKQLIDVDELINEFESKLKELSKTDLKKEEKKVDVIKGIWKNLLIDAISLLKINDTREKVYNERNNKEDNKDNLLDIFKVFNMTRKTSSYGIEEIVGYFDDFIDYESVLYGMNKYYRDHKKHVIQVWALGVNLIQIMNNDKRNIYLNDCFHTRGKDLQFDSFSIEEKVSEEGSNVREIQKSELWAMWTIIALCHDLGYPIEKTSQINKQARKIISHFGSMQFTELDYNFSLLDTHLIKKFLNIISSRVDFDSHSDNIDESEEFSKIAQNTGNNGNDGKGKHKTTIQEKYKDKLSKSLEDYKHGIFSSLLLFKNLTYFQETDYSSGDKGKLLTDEDARQFYIRKEILRSIAGHTCPKLYHIRLDTLAFLLILCDELQEWNRPRAESLLNLTKEEPPIVKLDEFKLGTENDSIKISMLYDLTSTKELVKYLVISRFKHIHYLLRSGKDDAKRGFKFIWAIKFKDETYELTYNSNKFSYELLIVESFTNNLPDEKKPVSLYD